MKWKTGVGIFIFLLVLQACESKKQSVLQGMWDLDIIASKDSLGQWQEAAWMENGTGLLHYATDGYMSVHFWPDTLKTPQQDPYWYVAKYRTEGDTVFHTRMMHSIEKENLKTAFRLFNIHQDTLYLSAPDYGFRLTWIKK